MLTVFNSLTRKKEKFEPMNPGEVSMYVCGMTVYDYCHLGHARVMVSFDVITRYLRAREYAVKHVCNITDVDDKIIRRANERNVTCDALTEEFIRYMHEDARALGVLSPNAEPKATDYIQEMQAFIQQLIDKDLAYVAKNGDVCYRIAGFEAYGKLSGQDISGLRAGARVDVDEGKDDPLDFVLWKLSKADEPAWDSPWGAGRPGWHIECSSMVKASFGSTIDIHGGGCDLQFPHHENEIAQSEGLNEKPLANYWLHVGSLQVNNEKMSKSLGNFFTIREVLEKFSPEVVRYFIVSSHYRSGLNYSESALHNSHAALTRFYTALRGVPVVECDSIVHARYQQKFMATMDDDFNTPEALAVLFDLVREMNRLREANETEALATHAATLRHLASWLGLLETDPETFLTQSIQAESTVDSDWVEAQIAARNQARTEKQWARADELRDALAARGVILEDSAEGTIWRLETPLNHSSKN